MYRRGNGPAHPHICFFAHYLYIVAITLLNPMIFVKKLVVITLLLFACCYLPAQEKSNLKFGNITPADFNMPSAGFDTSTGAVFIADIGSADFSDGYDGHQLVEYNYYYRVKIFDKKAFDAATRYIQVRKYGEYEDKITKLQAVTYNLEDGRVVATPLDQASIFTEKLDKNNSWKKFTMPAVKEGSIIEVQYTVKSDFFWYLREWTFQLPHPILWCEYTAAIPEFFNYKIISQGLQTFHINKQERKTKTYTIANGSSGISVNSSVNNSRWVMKNTAPLKKEKYITSLSNYASMLMFELTETKEPYVEHVFRTDWNVLTGELLNREDFGLYLDNPNAWLNDDIRQVVNRDDSKLQKAKKIFTYIRDNFFCTYHRGIYLETSLKDVARNKKGSVADINLLLVAMLRHEGIYAEPLILSTRSNGYVYEEYPLIRRYNYVIAGAKIDDVWYYLDASERRLGFNRLPTECFNGPAQVITTQKPYSINFVADSVKETKLTAVFVSNNNGKPAAWFTSTPGYHQSFELRNHWFELGRDKMMDEFKDRVPQDASISDLQIDSLKNFDEPVTIRYNISFDNFNSNLVYFNPMMGEGMTENYFRQPQRFYPIEMPYAMDEIYTLNMEVPQGYEIDELPKSVRINLNGDDGMFEYLVAAAGDRIMLKSRIKINRAYFPSTEYESLRNFFGEIVKKHSELFVFKKKK